jgi:hypothetical protein
LAQGTDRVLSRQLASESEKTLVNEIHQQSPELLELACYVAFVPRIEQRLLRGIRLSFYPQLDVTYEHRLWFSALVYTRNTSNFIFTAGMTNLLTSRVRQQLDPPCLKKLWQRCQQLTRHWDPLDRLERDLFFYAVTEDETGIQSVFRDLLRLITQHSEDPQTNRSKLLEISRRIKYSTALLSEYTADTPTAKNLINFAANSLHDPGSWSNLVEPQPLPQWLASAVPSLEKSRLGVELRHEAGQSRSVLFFSKPQDDKEFIEFDTPLPARLHIKAKGLDEPWIQVNEGSMVSLQPSATPIELTTQRGKHYWLEVKADGKEDDIEPAEEETTQNYYLAHTKEDESLAFEMRDWLKEQKIEVKLVEERPYKSAPGLHDETVKMMRLWTSSMQRVWQELSESDTSSSAGNLLLQVEDIEPPEGYNSPAQILDVRNWQRDSDQVLARNIAAKIADWTINSLEPVKDEFEEARNQLRAEIENPKTKPAHRLEIGDRLDEIGDTRRGVGVLTIANPLIQKLVNELESAETLPERRLEIGNTFEDFSGGDPRPGTGLDDNGWPDIDWVKIPAGEFVYGEGKEETTIYLDAFEIARYPVTNAQYQAFINDAAYDDDQWWRGLEKPDVEESDWPQGNRPKINVDWFESTAFTRWLSHRLGLKISLPHETQWERAARGTTGLEYPWGNEYQSGYANVDETEREDRPHNLGQTTSVGIYLHAGSPEGVLDLAGNVWEWCSNDYDRPTEKIEVPKTPVLRGSAWFGLPGVARTASRFRGDPDGRYYNIGFRLLRSPPS